MLWFYQRGFLQEICNIFGLAGMCWVFVCMNDPITIIHKLIFIDKQPLTLQTRLHIYILDEEVFLNRRDCSVVAVTGGCDYSQWLP